MKILIHVSALAILALALTLSAHAKDKLIAGPKGGRVLDNAVPRPEFFVEKDNKVTITFYDEQMKPVPATSQVVTAIAEVKSGKQKLEFEKQGDVLVSKRALPKGSDYNIVVQLKPAPDSKPKNYRFKFETYTCGGCKLAEYACTCDE